MLSHPPLLEPTPIAFRIPRRRCPTRPPRIQPARQRTRNYASPKSPTSTAPSFTRTSSSSPSTWDGFPSTSLFPSISSKSDPYELYPLRYTLVPVNASLRWQFGPIKGPVILRGNWDATFTLSATAIPRGAETHYFSYNMGVRRNFVPRNWRVTPYWDVRAGLGLIDAKGPLGVYYAQGQNFTYALHMGAGARYNFSPRYAFSVGLDWMHSVEWKSIRAGVFQLRHQCVWTDVRARCRAAPSSPRLRAIISAIAREPCTAPSIAAVPYVWFTRFTIIVTALCAARAAPSCQPMMWLQWSPAK